MGWGKIGNGFIWQKWNLRFSPSYFVDG